MKHFARILVLALAATSAVQADTVQTVDGRTLEGKISIDANGALSIAVDGKVTPVPLDKLKRARFVAPVNKAGLSDVAFRLYHGNWKEWPVLAGQPVDKSGRMTGPLLDLTPLGSEGGEDARRVFPLRQGTSLTRWSAPAVEGRPFTIRATITAGAGKGVILAQGGHQDGYSIYLKDGHLHFALRQKQQLIVARDEQPFPLNRPVKIMAELRADLMMALTVEGEEAATVELTDLLLTRPSEGLSVGYDQRPSMVSQYNHENHFQGFIENATLELASDALAFTGKLHAPKAGEYTFHLGADAQTQLEIGKLILKNANPGAPAAGKVQLAAGTHTFRLTYVQMAGQANGEQGVLNLHWEGPGLARQALSQVPSPQVNTWHPDNRVIPSAGVLMRDGSYYARPLEKLDFRAVHVKGAQLPRLEVSTLLMRALSLGQAQKLNTTKRGVLLMDGVYTSGKVMKIDAEKIYVSSIIFGIKEYHRDTDAAAVVFKTLDEDAAPRTLFRLHDGSMLFAEKFSVADGQLVMSNALCKDRTVPLAEVAEMQPRQVLDLLTGADQHWDNHSKAGQRFLQLRDLKIEEIVRQFREWQLRRDLGEQLLRETQKTMPELVAAEAAIKPRYEAERLKRDAANKVYQERRQAYEPARREHQAAEQRLTAECAKVDQAHSNVGRILQQRQWPAFKKLEAVEKEIAEKGETDDLKNRRAQAQREVDQAGMEAARHEQTISGALQNLLTVHSAEREAARREQAAWAPVAVAKAAYDELQEKFRPLEVEYQDKHRLANEVRHKNGHASREISTAKQKMEELRPGYEAVIGQ